MPADQEIAHRALSLLAAAEANDGPTPETDARVQSYFLPGAKTVPSIQDFDDLHNHAETMEQQRNAALRALDQAKEE